MSNSEQFPEVDGAGEEEIPVFERDQFEHGGKTFRRLFLFPDRSGKERCPVHVADDGEVYGRPGENFSYYAEAMKVLEATRGPVWMKVSGRTGELRIDSTDGDADALMEKYKHG